MKVKICGITHPEDAEHAARSGADYIGIIFAERSKPRISPARAKEISQAARRGGAVPVGVFADEDADRIHSICGGAEINVVQLHGTGSKHCLPFLLGRYSVIFAFPVNLDGSLREIFPLPEGVCPLFDCLGGGTGQSFDWNAFALPMCGPWMLAGGLNPQNVSLVVQLLKPDGVDVSSGVELLHSTRKCPRLVEAFIQKTKKAL